MHTLVVTSFLILLGTIETYGFNFEEVRDGLGDIDLGDLFEFNVETFLKTYGYPFENHEVVTGDGYILGIHRIPSGRGDSPDANQGEPKPVVLLMHGLGGSSVDYFILGPERSLALTLADAGYDTWLGNNRGNTWSRKHLTLDPDQDVTFWDFSFHELGEYDLPAIIDHILNTTGQESISYVSHSQGATELFVALSTKPEYNGNINYAVAMAPLVYMDHMENEVIQVAKDLYAVIELAVDSMNLTEFFPHPPLLSMALSVACSDRSPFQQMCMAAYSLLGGESDQLNKTALSIIVQSYQGGSSIKEWKHYLQEVKSGKFRQFDYGLITNFIRYGQADPPAYDLSKVVTQTLLIYGGKDNMVSPTDVNRLVEDLGTSPQMYFIENFSYHDFMFGIGTPPIYRSIVKLLDFARS